MKLFCTDLKKQYGKRMVVKGVSLEVEQGEIVGLLGPNGAGKTTSFYMIVGLIKPNSGRIFLGDREIPSLPMYRRAQLGVGYLAQEASVFRNMSVENNILSVMEMAGFERKVRQRRVEELIDDLGLHKVRKSLGIQLFPYTTLFRSAFRGSRPHRRRGHPAHHSQAQDDEHRRDNHRPQRP